MIRKVNGYKAFSGTKGALSKKAKTKAEAIKQHMAVQASQVRRGEREEVVSPVSGKPTGWKPDGKGRFKKMARKK
jgi:hypothetical protein